MSRTEKYRERERDGQTAWRGTALATLQVILSASLSLRWCPQGFSSSFIYWSSIRHTLRLDRTPRSIQPEKYNKLKIKRGNWCWSQSKGITRTASRIRNAAFLFPSNSPDLVSTHCDTTGRPDPLLVNDSKLSFLFCFVPFVLLIGRWCHLLQIPVLINNFFLLF